MRRITKKNRDRGSVLLLAAILLLVLIGVAALAVDVGRLHVAKQRAQNVCDACALAGAWALQPAGGLLLNEAKAAAQDCASASNQSQNMKVLQPGTTTEGIAVTDLQTKSITVEGEVEVNFGFAQVLGSGTQFKKDRVKTSATAILEENSGFRYPFVPLAITTTFLAARITTSSSLLTKCDLQTEWWHVGANTRTSWGSVYTLEMNGGSDATTYEDQLNGLGQAFRLALGDPTQGRSTNPIPSTITALTSRLNGDTTAFATWKGLSAAGKAAFPAPQHFVIMPVVTRTSLDARGIPYFRIDGFAGFYIESCERVTGGTIYKPEECLKISGYFVPGVVGPKSVHWLSPFPQEASETNLIYRVRLTN